jgi:hypothetical protein
MYVSHHRSNLTAPYGRPNLRSRLHFGLNQEGDHEVCWDMRWRWEKKKIWRAKCMPTYKRGTLERYGLQVASGDNSFERLLIPIPSADVCAFGVLAFAVAYDQQGCGRNFGCDFWQYSSVGVVNTSVLQPSEFLSFGSSNPSTPKRREAEGSFRVISLFGLCTLQSCHKVHFLCHRILSGYQIFQTFTIPSPCTTRSVARSLSLSLSLSHTHTHTHTLTLSF